MHIKAQKLNKVFGSREVVQDISLDLKPGKILALLGPNGAGKSTIIKMLTGQLKPTKGSIKVDGEDYESFPDHMRAQLGVMPQEIVIWDDLTILENLRFSASLHKLSKQLTTERIHYLMTQLKLESEKDTLARNLSGGYKRRLHLANSIIHDPKVIFLDEPTPGIDAQSRILLTEYIQQLVDTGNYSILLTDHYLDEAEKLADYVVIFDRGQVVDEGTVAQLKSRHGDGNIMQIHIDPGQGYNEETLLSLFKKDFAEVKLSKNALVSLVEKPQQALQKALDISEKNNLELLDVTIKQSSLEDVFLLITGRDIRE